MLVAGPRPVVATHFAQRTMRKHSHPQRCIDYFKIRRFRLLLELADGSTVSSYTSTAVFTQPIGWPHAEGILVDFSKNIVVPIAFTPLAKD